MKFRKKPVVIDAVKWTGSNKKEIDMFIPPEEFRSHSEHKDLSIFTLEGVMLARPGDWIIKGIKGEFYPCKPEIFEATYEPVKEGK